MVILLENANSYLLSDYEVDEIIDREEQVELLRRFVFSPLEKDKQAFTCYVYGTAGTGKTHTIKNLMNKMEEKEGLYRFWFNCRDTRSFHELLIKILKRLEKDGFIERVPLRGFGTGWLFGVLKQIVEENSLKILVVADEVNQLKLRDVDDLLYSFLENPERLYLIAISNDPFLDSKFTSSVISRLSVKIHFPKYSAQELFLILKAYAKLSLKEGSYTDDDLMKIAKFVGSETGSARDAKRILYFIAEKSLNNLNVAHLEKAVEEKNKLMYEKDLEKLPLQEKIALLSVIEVFEEFEKRKIASKNLKRFLLNPQFYPTIQNAYKVYLSLCQEYGLETKHINTFRLFIKDLEKSNLISCEIKSFGKSRGITTIVKPTLNIDLKPIVLNSLKYLI